MHTDGQTDAAILIHVPQRLKAPKTPQTCSGELIMLQLSAEVESVSVKLVPSSELCELKEMESAC
jgi:hypothetical protein